MILYFNTGQYDKIVEISEEIDISLFNHRGKREYEFMLGHIKYLQEEPFEAYNLLKKCENYFLIHKYYGDLCMLYEDLYCITDNPIYKKKKDECKTKIGRKNITTASL